MECQRCGNCCPTDCKHLVIEKEEPRATRCEVYDDPEHKGVFCCYDPVKLYIDGIACRAFFAYTGRKPIVWKTSDGQIVYK